MRDCTRNALFLISALLINVSSASLATATDDAAHALAARFSGGTGTGVQNEDQRKAEEAEILERARAEATAREAEAKRAGAARVTAASEARNELLARQAAALAAAAEANRADQERAEAERQAKLAVEEAARSAEAAQQASNKAETEAQPSVQPSIPSDSNVEASNLAEKLRRVRANRPEGAMGLGVPPPETAEPADVPAGTITSPERQIPVLPPSAVRNATSVTVLLVMEPGTTGIRIGSKTADPVICLDTWCYVSTGPNSPAKIMTRGETLGPINTLGQRAGACRQSLTCIYRGLDVAAYFTAGAKPASMQPIDLRYLHHDRRQPMALPLNEDCTALNGELRCASVIKGKGWTAWVIPEELAVKAGADALQAALDNGLAVTGATTRAANLMNDR